MHVDDEWCETDNMGGASFQESCEYLISCLVDNYFTLTIPFKKAARLDGGGSVSFSCFTITI